MVSKTSLLRGLCVEMYCRAFGSKSFFNLGCLSSWILSCSARWKYISISEGGYSQLWEMRPFNWGIRFLLETRTTSHSEKLFHMCFEEPDIRTNLLWVSRAIHRQKSLCQRIALHRSQMNIPKNKKIAFSQYVNICTNINNSRFRIFPCIKSVKIKSVANELVKSCSFFITRYIPLLNAST